MICESFMHVTWINISFYPCKNKDLWNKSDLQQSKCLPWGLLKIHRVCSVCFINLQIWMYWYVFEIIVEKWNEAAVLQLRTAFSRDQKEKIYVQDLLLEDGILIWNLVNKVRNNYHPGIGGFILYVSSQLLAISQLFSKMKSNLHVKWTLYGMYIIPVVSLKVQNSWGNLYRVTCI